MFTKQIISIKTLELEQKVTQIIETLIPYGKKPSGGLGEQAIKRIFEEKTFLLNEQFMAMESRMVS